eukprot:gene10188-biopygen4915
MSAAFAILMRVRSVGPSVSQRSTHSAASRTSPRRRCATRAWRRVQFVDSGKLWEKVVKS